MSRNTKGNKTEEMKKNNLIGELWKGSCPNCHSSKKPMVLFFENEEKQEIIISCPICGCSIACIDIKNEIIDTKNDLNSKKSNNQRPISINH